jgi:hypothetical protein
MSIIADSIAKIGVGFGVQHTARLGLADGGGQARSGYWRLFFYQMQEEALREDKKEQEVTEQEIVISKAKKRVQKPVVTKKQPVKEHLSVKTVPQPKPTTHVQAPEVRHTVLDAAWQATLYLRQLLASYAPVALNLELIYEKRRRQRQDDELLLLLLT